MTRGMRVAAPGLAGLGLLALVLTVNPESRSKMMSLAFDAGHAVVFGCVALAVYLAARAAWPGASARRLLIAGAAAGFGLGAAVEVVQYFGPRDADIGDVGRNALGVAAFLLAGWGAHRRGWSRWGLALLGTTFLAAAFTPLFALAAARHRRDAGFPLLAGFDARVEESLYRWPGAEVAFVPAPAGWTGHGAGTVARVRFVSGSYPGLNMLDMARDWTGYRTLAFDVYSEESETRPLLLLVQDLHHNHDWHDRYNAVFRIDPGPHTVRIPLEEIRTAPASRTMDLTAMRGMIFFADHPAESPYTLYLDDVRLEP